MALILPQSATLTLEPAEARLEETLAALPDDWLLLRDRHIGGKEGPLVRFVLVHPEIGVALVDLPPREPTLSVGALRALLDSEGWPERDTEALPIVSLTIPPDEIADVGDRLAAAFATVPECRMADERWPDRIADLLLSAEDAAMAPLPGRTAEPVAPAQAAPMGPAPDLPRLLADEEPILSASPPPRRRALAAIATIAVLVGIADIAIMILTAPPPPGSAAASAAAPISTPPPAPQAARPAEPDRSATPVAPVLGAASPVPSPPPAVQAPPAPPAAAQSSPNPIWSKTGAEAAGQDYAAPAPAPTQPTPAATVAEPPPERQSVEARPHRASRPKPKPEAKDSAVAALAAPAKPDATADSANGPPIDIGDLPPLEGNDAPPAPQQTTAAPGGAPVPLTAPYLPAANKPVSLLPPVSAPADLPKPPAYSANYGGQ